MRCLRYLLLATILMSLAISAIAQDATGKITGTIKDQQGAVIANAKVIILNVATGIKVQTETGTDGTYQVLNLPIGNYSVTVEHPGFSKVTTEPRPLQINQVMRIDLVMQIGSLIETVEVSGSATVVETFNPTLGNSVTSRPIVNMPLNGRNVLDLATLEPGVTEQNSGNAAAGSFSISGGRTDSVTFLLDGGVNNNLLDNGIVFNPNPDTVEEFRILESNYSAEYGRNGGGIISVVTKSGTNAFHGSAFEFIRNDALDANSFFNNAYGITKEKLRRNQFGGTLGGPIRKDKAFFFIGYQGQRKYEGVHPGIGIPAVFTPAELTGDFSASADKASVAAYLLSNPFYQPNAAKAAQGIIDPTKIDPVAQAYIKAGIIPTSATGFQPNQSTQKTNFDQYIAKLDYVFSQNDRVNATLGMDRAPGNRPYAGSATAPFPVNDQTNRYYLNLAYTKSFTSTFLNELRFTSQRLNDNQGTPALKLPTGPELGAKITPDLAAGPPIVYFVNSGSLYGFSYRGPVIKVNNTFGLSDTVSWIKGHHTLKGGFWTTIYQNNTQYAYEVNGEYDYYGSTSGSEFADFLLGAADEYIQSANAPSNIRTKNFSGFFQDEWRIGKHLVLNFGLRYEYSTPKFDTQGRSFSFIPGLQSKMFQNVPVGLVFPGDTGAPRGSNFPDKNDFAPRFGFAWDPTGSGRTSVRGGFGVFYDILKGEDNLQFNGQAPFFGYTDIVFDPWKGPGAAQYMIDPYGASGTTNTFPSTPPTSSLNFDNLLPFGGSSVYFVDPNLRTPYVYQYNLSVQRELGKDFRLDASYVGSTAHKLTSLVDNNPFPLGGGANRIWNTQPGTPSYSYSYLDTFKNVGYQNYNSLQTAVRKQLTKSDRIGATYFTLGYTWQKNIDTATGFREGSSRVKYYAPGADRAASDLDVTHRITFSGGWDLPFASLWTAGPKKLTDGWSLYPIVTTRTGFPIDIRGFLSRSRKVQGPSCVGDPNMVRPNLTTGRVGTLDPYTNINDAGALYWSPADFDISYAAGTCTYGTMPRNFIRGLGRSNVDMSIAKMTNLTERYKLEFKADFFNMFNMTEFDDPSGTNPKSSGSFGRITTTAPPRQIQFAAKFIF